MSTMMTQHNLIDILSAEPAVLSKCQLLKLTQSCRYDPVSRKTTSLKWISLWMLAHLSKKGIPVMNHNIATSSVSVKNNHILMIGGLRFKHDINVSKKT